MKVVDAASYVTSYPFSVSFDYRFSPRIFPKDLGIYWFTVHNPNQTEPVDITFGRFDACKIAWLGGEEIINQTLRDEYDKPLPPPTPPTVPELSMSIPVITSICALVYIFTSMHAFVINQKLKRRLETMRNQALLSFHCNQSIEPDQIIVRRMSNGKAKFYHKSCWQKLFI